MSGYIWHGLVSFETLLFCNANWYIAAHGCLRTKKVASCQCWIRAACDSLLPQLDRIGMGLVPNNLWRKDNKSNGRENNVPSICLLFGGCPHFRQTHVGQELILKLSFCCRVFLATLCWYHFDFTSHFAKATCFGPSWLACWHFVAFHLLHHCEWRMILLFGDQVTKDSPQRDDRIHILLSASNSVTWPRAGQEPRLVSCRRIYKSSNSPTSPKSGYIDWWIVLVAVNGAYVPICCFCRKSNHLNNIRDFCSLSIFAYTY